MKNKLQRASLFMILVLSFIKIDAQKIKFEVSLPLISYQINNVPYLKGDINKSYANDYYIPNIRFTAKYRRFISGIEYYKHIQKASNIFNHPTSGKQVLLNINSTSLLLGYEVLKVNSLSINLGSGVTYNKPNLLTYYEYAVFLGDIENNKIGPIFWTSISKNIVKNFNVSLNLRYNPMFKSFQDGFKYDHDRLNYFVSQLSIGYEF